MWYIKGHGHDLKKTFQVRLAQSQKGIAVSAVTLIGGKVHIEVKLALCCHIAAGGVWAQVLGE